MASPLDNAPAFPGSNQTAISTSRSALAVGTVGRVGEELLNCLLESLHYKTVNVIVQAPMRSMLPRLQPWQVPPSALSDCAREASAIALPRVDDVFCCISDARSYFKRDQAYVRLRREQIPLLAQRAAQSGARRLIVLSPLSAFLQLTASSAGLIDLLETELAGLGLEVLVIMRPAADFRTAEGNTLERLIAWGAKAIMQIMIPQHLQPLRARQIALAAVNAARLLGPGVHVIGAHEIEALASPGVPVKPKRMRL